MNVFSRSWQITKMSFSVINKDRELLAFALLSFVFSAIFSIAMIVPSVLSDVLNQGRSVGELEVYQYIIIFATYFGLAFIATFFNVCVVYTAKIRFEGGNATFGESIRFAFSRIGLIVRWSLLSASVGLLLNVLERAVSSFGKVGEIVGRIIIGLMGAAWSIATIFVVPILVYDGLGPIDAVKKSMSAVKETWGENIVRSIGLGLMTFFAYVIVIAGGVGLTILLANSFDVAGMITGIVIGGCLLLFTGLLFKVAGTVFTTALFVYANEKIVASDYDSALIEGAFKPKK
ncbi:MAG: hypothetical protein CMB80_34200 [Flammeovirgaceae bacterium]|nr:hypothetical protein [Flammeovirgaceae bacterium]HCX24874.1 hypothetical protein [Cytophagales bacterium]|tara:strand:- start:4415 stop:5281 length:867 start_codon:yes stop_codon:yes gene_type:complete